MRIILDTDYEQNFVDLWNPEKNYWERYIQCEEKEETKTTTRESIEALGYACGEIQKCFTNGWKKSLKNKSLNEEDKKIRKITLLGEEVKLGLLSNWLKDSTNNEEKIASCIECNAMKINEIIDYINGGTNGE